VLKEQIEFLQNRVEEKTREIEEKNKTIDLLHTEKRMF